MDKSSPYPPPDDNENSLKCLLKQEKNEQTTFSGGGIGNGGSSVTTRSQRAAAASKNNESMTGRRQQIDGGGVACVYKGHHNYQQSVVKTEPCTNVAINDNGKVLCLPLHQTTPDTTGSPEGQPEYSLNLNLKRPAEDVDNPEVHTQGGGSSPNLLQRPRSKRPRRMYTPDQVQVLEKMFMDNEYPTAQDRVLLSAVTQLSTEKVKVWFQNRRSRERRRRQNQLHNNVTMKRMAPAPKPPPCFTLSHPAVTANPHGLTLPKNFTLNHPSTARSITPPPAPSQQQLAQAFSQSANYAFSHPMQTDINNNNNVNNNNNMTMSVAQSNQFMRSTMGGKHPFSNMYAKLCPSNVQPPAAAGSLMDSKDAVGPMHVPKSVADTYTPLVPAWSQSWPMFPAAPQGGPPQLQKMMQPMDDFCMDNTNRWGAENPTSNLHTATNYGQPGTGANVSQNKPGFQEHYPYAAMIPAGYLPYGYPYYPPAMYQNPQMGLYPQQAVPPVSTNMAPYLGPNTETVPTSTTKATTSHSQAMVSQSVRLALQRKLDNTQKCYNWHYQTPASQSTTRLLEQPTYLDSQSKGADNNDALSDSSTLSSPERTSSPIKPLATSSPNSNHPVGCEVPFSIGDNDKGIDNNTVRMQDLWPQNTMPAEAFDKNNNNNINNNNLDIVVPTPYPNVAGYYNDFTPPTSSSYSQPTTTAWGNVRVNHIGNSSPSYGYKLTPDWPITTTTSADRYSSPQTLEEQPSRPSSSGCYQFSLSDPPQGADFSPQVESSHLPQLSATPTRSYPASSSSPISPDGVMLAATAGSTGYSDISSNGGEEEEEEDGGHTPCEMAPPPPPPAAQVARPPPSEPACREANVRDVQQEPHNNSPGAASGNSPHAVYVLSDTE